MTMIEETIDSAGIVRGAMFSDCRAYRYRLWRTWDAELPIMSFVMLNPSTADAQRNDATVERCEQRARRMGMGGIAVANVFAYRATDPRALYKLAPADRHGPTSPDNRTALLWAIGQDGPVIAGWGAHASKLDLGGLHALEMMAVGLETRLLCLMANADGSPRHPLYCSYERPPIHWGGASSVVPVVS